MKLIGIIITVLLLTMCGVSKNEQKQKITTENNITIDIDEPFIPLEPSICDIKDSA